MTPQLIAYPPTHETTYHYRIDGIEHLSPCDVRILFRDGKFIRTALPFPEPYDLEHWKVLGLVAQEIENLASK
ncbi:MAG: hypothetical protein ACO3GP_09180 [Candidatus Limnocylindrus sp.]|jgi:hypothetical protein